MKSASILKSCEALYDRVVAVARLHGHDTDDIIGIQRKLVEAKVATARRGDPSADLNTLIN